MCKKLTLGVFALLTWIAFMFQGLTFPALAKTKITGADIQADDKIVREILASFHKAEEFLEARNLDGLMGLYSKDYNYNGFKKDDVRKIWERLFTQYQRIASSHMFSKIIVVAGKNPTADITCTGSLWATTVPTGHRVNIDSWFEEVHHMVYQDGAWRIRGHAGGAPKVLQFGSAPHPLF